MKEVFFRGCPEAPLERKLSTEAQEEIKAALTKVKRKAFCTDIGRWYVSENPPKVSWIVKEGECEKCHGRHCVILRKWEQ